MLKTEWVKLDSYKGSEQQIAIIATFTRRGTPKDYKKLLKVLMDKKHYTPLEFAVLHFYLKMPLFVAAQWKRYRTASISELSMRHVNMKEAEFWPGSNTQHNMACLHEYNRQIESGIRKEQARMALPTSIMTEMHWQINLRNLLHLLEERLSNTTQAETRLYAEAVRDVTAMIFPTICELAGLVAKNDE